MAVRRLVGIVVAAGVALLCSARDAGAEPELPPGDAAVAVTPDAPLDAGADASGVATDAPVATSASADGGATSGSADGGATPTSGANETPMAPTESPVALKVYGDTMFQLLNRGPVKASFEAAHLDLFFTADVGKLSFLSEVFFEGESSNEVAVDVERLQVAYLFDNWLRVRAGRSHTAFGYYNDTYHHGSIFELTAERPFAVAFEDRGGLFAAHLVGVGADGTFDLGRGGGLRYDVEVGNGRPVDPTKVAIVHADKTEKMVNLRLRWLAPVEGLTVGANGVYDLAPEIEATATDPGRRKVVETIGAIHAAYMEHGVHFLAEGYDVHHAASGGGTFDTWGGFVELGYTLGAFTPYLRPEFIRFPDGGDPVFQRAGAPWDGTREVFDARVGVRWFPLPQLAVKLEGERIARGSVVQELLSTKLGFGF